MRSKYALPSIVISLIPIVFVIVPFGLGLYFPIASEWLVILGQMVIITPLLGLAGSALGAYALAKKDNLGAIGLVLGLLVLAICVFAMLVAYQSGHEGNYPKM